MSLPGRLRPPRPRDRSVPAPLHCNATMRLDRGLPRRRSERSGNGWPHTTVTERSRSAGSKNTEEGTRGPGLKSGPTKDSLRAEATRQGRQPSPRLSEHTNSLLNATVKALRNVISTNGRSARSSSSPPPCSRARITTTSPDWSRVGLGSGHTAQPTIARTKPATIFGLTMLRTALHHNSVLACASMATSARVRFDEQQTVWRGRGPA
jgi:hypothetical protein